MPTRHGRYYCMLPFLVEQCHTCSSSSKPASKRCHPCNSLVALHIVFYLIEQSHRKKWNFGGVTEVQHEQCVAAWINAIVTPADCFYFILLVHIVDANVRLFLFPVEQCCRGSSAQTIILLKHTEYCHQMLHITKGYPAWCDDKTIIKFNAGLAKNWRNNQPTTAFLVACPQSHCCTLLFSCWAMLNCSSMQATAMWCYHCNWLAAPHMLFLLLEQMQNSQRKKSNLQQSDIESIAHLQWHCHDNATNDLLHCQMTPSVHQLIVF